MPNSATSKPKSAVLSTLVFDVNETLLDLTTLEPLFERIFGDAQTMRLWFSELILYSQTLTLNGHYKPFGALAAAVMTMVAHNHGKAISEDDISELKARIGGMPAYEDVAPALTRLRAAGFHLVTLTNSAPSGGVSALEAAKIDHLFDAHYSVHDTQKFKPHPQVYADTAKHLNAEPSSLCMIACHVWDTIGAQSAGWHGAFVARPHNSTLELSDVPTPNIVASDLSALADQLIAARQA